MSSPAQRMRDLEIVARNLRPEEVPTACFFAIDRHQAAAGYGGQTALEILESIEAVNAAIAHYDAFRSQHRLDVVDFAILVSRTWHTDYAQTPSAVAGSIVQAFFHWDKERYGEDRAWRQQRSRGEFEGQIAARLVGSATG